MLCILLSITSSIKTCDRQDGKMALLTILYFLWSFSLETFHHIILTSPFHLNCFFILYIANEICYTLPSEHKGRGFTQLYFSLKDLQFSASEVVICSILPSMKILHLNSLHLKDNTSCSAAAVPNIALFFFTDSNTKLHLFKDSWFEKCLSFCYQTQ